MSTQGPADGPASSASDAGLKIWSCVICRRRKVKCDRKDPCSNCVRAGIDCHYPVTGRVPRRTRDPSAWRSPAQKQSELLSRLRRLEAVVTELSAQVEEGPGESGATLAPGQPNSSLSVSGSTSSPETSQSEGRSIDQSLISSASDSLGANPPPGSEFDEEFGRLVVDKDGSLHVGNRFWSVFCDEVDNIFQAVNDVADYNEPNDSNTPSVGPVGAPGHQGFVFGNSGNSGNLEALNPLPSQMLFIWQTFVENVDPFIKVLHIPSIDKIIRDLRGNFSSLGPNMEPLLFAISLAAIASMDDEAVATNFNAPKSHFLARFRLGTEQALGQAEFLTTKDIVVVQAFVIYLSVLPYIGASESAWSLTGLLLRIAKSMGLHRNVKSRHQNQLETELRRRLWWHICFLDSKTQRPGIADLSISETSFDTELPATTEDAQLDSPTVTISNTKSTSLILCLVRCEIWRVVQALKANSTNTPEVKLQIFQAAKSRIEGNYLRGLHPDLALGNFIKTMASMFFAKVELVLHKASIPANPKASRESHGQDSMFSVLRASITIINTAHALTTEPAWAKWRWQLAGHVPWHAIGVFLRQACRQPWGPESEQVWITTRSIIGLASEDAKNDRLWLPLVGLAKTTETHREAEMARWTAEALAGQALSGLPVEQWRGKIGDGTVNSLSYPTSQLDGMVIGPRASNPGYPPTLENADILQTHAISQSAERLGSVSGNPLSGLHLQSANPTLWSPLVEMEAMGHMELPNAIQADEGNLMDWDAWDMRSPLRVAACSHDSEAEFRLQLTDKMINAEKISAPTSVPVLSLTNVQKGPNAIFIQTLYPIMGFSSLYTQLFPPKPTLTEENVPSQKGRVFIVTGGNSGVGYELCKILYGTGATIYMASRSQERATNAIKQITDIKPPPATPGTLKFLPLDLNDLQSEPAPSDVEPFAKTVQGLESMVGMHCVATLLFTQLLEPQLRAAAAASSTSGAVRVVWTASIAADQVPPNGIEFELLDTGTEDRVRNYGVSKVSSWMLSREMAQRNGKHGIVSIAQNPGNVKAGSYEGAPATLMFFMNRILHEPKFGAYTELYAGLSPEITLEHNGAYVIPWGRIRPDSECPREDVIKAMTSEEAGGLGYGKRFWDWCEQQWQPYV
ncbi:hypothetical protein G7Z17_g7799 [Cylindrodendrum hubeiense]|uniref:Zn(2)-C6 fungal-type domain-containing protein n=1 Tax=Cylindrodendrum hubeiense TaxID=595255 RepID=A0A9P5H2C9_9HYPO|nr:hypothetical protein G7Z17_g7799 [Cylindrodendrum hubeiense]